MVQTNTFVKVKPPDIGFNKLNDAGSKLAKVASSHSNALQHVALSAIAAIMSMLKIWTTILSSMKILHIDPLQDRQRQIPWLLLEC